MKKNDYLEQVMAQQEQVDQALSMPVSRQKKRRPGHAQEAEIGAIDYRITGFWRIKNVIVPPNIYAVHTRRGHTKPIHVGLGLSFRYDPYRDTFILIPAAVQTLLISANCVCQERQGILVQAYVQWVVDDVNLAYQRLDFSPLDEPMRIVNIQLKEQAEAAIKDKVTTMSIEAVLSDKQPIIEELTTRLRTVAEGTQAGEGLGLKIVTVQIKEAVVSSISLWENLQKPFRAERQQVARMADLDSQQQISARELENKRTLELEKIGVEEAVSVQRHDVDKQAFSRGQAEKNRRSNMALAVEREAIKANAETQTLRQHEAVSAKVKEMELQREQMAHEVQTVQCEQALNVAIAERDEATLRQQLARAALEYAQTLSQQQQAMDLSQQQQDIDNSLSDNHLSAKLVAQLPEVVSQMPKPETLHAISMGEHAQDSLTGTLAQLMLLMKKLSTNDAGINPGQASS